MFQRVNHLSIDLPEVAYGDLNGAIALQQLLAGKFGIAALFSNYMLQSANFRDKIKLKPFYDLIASITAEKCSQVELVSTAISILNKGTASNLEVKDTEIKKRKSPSMYEEGTFIGNSSGITLNEDALFSCNHLVLDLMQNFYLECSARTHQAKYIQMSNHPIFKEVMAYLLVRSTTHIVAYAKALEMATGVEIPKMLPMLKIQSTESEEIQKYEQLGYGNILYTWNTFGDYTDMNKIWKGKHPLTGQPLIVKEGIPNEGGKEPNLNNFQDQNDYGIGLEEFQSIAKRLLAKQ